MDTFHEEDKFKADNLKIKNFIHFNNAEAILVFTENVARQNKQ
jgi:hypothetical protein